MFYKLRVQGTRWSPGKLLTCMSWLNESFGSGVVLSRGFLGYSYFIYVSHFLLVNQLKSVVFACVAWLSVLVMCIGASSMSSRKISGELGTPWEGVDVLQEQMILICGFRYILGVLFCTVPWFQPFLSGINSFCLHLYLQVAAFRFHQTSRKLQLGAIGKKAT